MIKKDQHKVFLILFVLIIITIALIVALNSAFFDSLIKENIEKYGYPGVLITVFVTDLIDQPIGPEVPASIAGVFGLNLLVVFLLAVVGSWISSIINYNIGKRLLQHKIRNSCSLKEHKNYCKLFSKYGDFALLLGAVTPIPYATVCYLSGAFNMEKIRFLLFGLVPRALRIGIIMVIAYQIF